MKKERLEINFLASDAEKSARRTTLLVAGVFTLLVALLSGFGASVSYRAADSGVSILSEVGNFFSFNSLTHLSWNSNSTTDGKDLFATPDGRLNILFLGVGGDGHDGPQLTDTIIYASYNKESNAAGLVSIPRDLAYPLGNGRFEKINSVNAYNEIDHPGQGAELTAQDFSKLLSTRIDRVVKIDFKGFEEFIDALGGVDVTVEKTFTDYQFPTDDNGPDPYKWTTVTFTKGVEHMNGARALTYARSRHAAGSEGSDFARSRRQALVIEAVRDRLLSLGTLSDPKKLSDLWTALSTHIQTNFTAWDLLKLVPYASQLTHVTMQTQVLTDDPATGQLVAGNVNGAFMLFPKTSDWTEIKKIVADPFATSTPSTTNKTPAASVPTQTTTPTTQSATTTQTKQQATSVSVRNGTTHAGLAASTAAQLQKAGFTVVGTGNAKRQTMQQTVVYDLTNGARASDLTKLLSILHARSSSPDSSGRILYPDGASEPVPANADFLIILGEPTSNTYASSTTP